MSNSPTVDVHIHLYPSPTSADWSLTHYDIWEYGEKAHVQYALGAGTVREAAELFATQGLDHGVVVNLFARDLFREEAIGALDPDLSPPGRATAIAAVDAHLDGMMMDFNRWLVEAVRPIPELTPYVAVDPSVLSPEANVAHLAEMVRAGARGIKVHPVLQRFRPDDHRMTAVYEACVDANLVVLSHGGGARDTDQFAEPAAFAAVMREHPELRLVVAHLGGAKWRQTPALAAAFPTVAFDLSEIIQWMDATNGITRQEFVQLVLDIGTDRVMLGTDYPWYDLPGTQALLMELPGLSEAQKLAIAGENAVRILSLTGF